MRPILFLVSTASSYRLQKYVAEHLVREGRPVAFLYERGEDATFELIARDASTLGGEARALESVADPQSRSGPLWRRHPRLTSALAIWARVAGLLAVRRLRSLARRILPARVTRLVDFDSLPGDVLQLEALRRILASQLAAARAVLADLQPAAIVACEDGISAPLAVHAAARHAGVPVVVVPYGYGVRRDLEISLDAKAARGELIMLSGRWAGLIRDHAPQWIKKGLHEGALMYPEAYLLAAESLGITLRDAWVIHGGYACRLCVECEQMKRVYLDEGVPESKLVLTGTPYCDVMVRAVERSPAARAALRRPRRIDPAVTRVLVSWPPSYHADRAAFSEFATYREMSLASLGWLSRLPGCAVTVSVHPATLAEDRAALIEIGVQLTDDYVIGLIPQHDVFVTYFSSTIRWAVAAGKPVVNFDVYRLGLTVYDAAPGVLTVSALVDFQRELSRLVDSIEAFTDLATAQIASAEAWGVLDGRNTERVASLIASVALPS